MPQMTVQEIFVSNPIIYQPIMLRQVQTDKQKLPPKEGSLDEVY